MSDQAVHVETLDTKMVANCLVKGLFSPKYICPLTGQIVNGHFSIAVSLNCAL